jgi:hypothetical protein
MQLKININITKLKEQNLTLIEYLYLFCKNNDIEINQNDFELSLYELESKGYIIQSKDGLILTTPKSRDITITDSEIGTKNFQDLIIILREKFHKANVGIIGKMGDLKNVSKKLELFLKEYPQFDYDTILKATDLYISSVRDKKYLMQLDYFISKEELVSNKRLIKSKLATFCEEINMGHELESEIKEDRL